MRFHVIGLPHAPTTKSHNTCAYTAKVYKFCKMMSKRGHEVIHYGVEGSDPDCTENVITLTSKEYSQYFFGHDPTKDYYPVVWDSNLPYWKISNHRAISEITSRVRRNDIICIIGGTTQKPIADCFDNNITPVVEYGIGYTGTFAKYRVFESYSHMHKLYGNVGLDIDGNFFDAVIPNYFDLDDFSVNENPTNDYLLFVGRLIQRKGLSIAVDLAKATKKKLLIYGQGVKEEYLDGILCQDNCRYWFNDNVHYKGTLDVVKRNEVMGNAAAIIVPTIYLEPFGGVAVEAQLTGSPAITTDWGAFPETVIHGVTGYRCRTMDQFVWAANNLGKLCSRQDIANRARGKYSTETVGEMFEEYFNMIQSVITGKGFYQPNPLRTDLNWLN